MGDMDMPTTAAQIQTATKPVYIPQLGDYVHPIDGRWMKIYPNGTLTPANICLDGGVIEDGVFKKGRVTHLLMDDGK